MHMQNIVEYIRTDVYHNILCSMNHLSCTRPQTWFLERLRICMYVYIHVFVCIYIYIYMYICMHAYIYLCTYVFMYAFMYVFMYACMNECMCVCVCAVPDMLILRAIHCIASPSQKAR